MAYNVLFLLHLPPPVHGSSMVGKYIKDSQIINQDLNNHFINLLASENTEEIGKVTSKKISGYLKIIYKLISTLLLNRPEICYFALSTTGTAFIKDSLLVALIKLFRVPIIFHLHHKGIKNYANKKAYFQLYKFVFRKTKVILLSFKLYEEIEKFVKKENVVICPNGIPEVSNAPNNTNKPVQEQNHIIKFLFLSNLMESKGVFFLLEACALLKQNGYKFLLKIVGSEGNISQKDLTIKIESLGIQNEVTYLGRKYGKEKEDIFFDSDVFVFPTFYETFGLVNLEAMQYGLPIISCDEGAIADIIKDGENGFIIPPKNAKALAEKMIYLIENPGLIKKMGTRGLEHFKNKFTLDIFERRIKEILLDELKN